MITQRPDLRNALFIFFFQIGFVGEERAGEDEEFPFSVIEDYAVLGEHETGIMISTSTVPDRWWAAVVPLAYFLKEGVHAVVREVAHHATEEPGRLYVHIAET